MKSETIEFDVKKAFENDLPAPVHVGPFDVSLYESETEIPTGERLTSDQYVAAVNARIKAKKRASETTSALEAAAKAYTGPKPNPYEKPSADDPDVIKENMIKLNMKLYKLDRATAEKIVASAADMAAAAKV